MPATSVLLLYQILIFFLSKKQNPENTLGITTYHLGLQPPSAPQHNNQPTVSSLSTTGTAATDTTTQMLNNL
jgi:hypothetical protein